ncbi:MAG: EVE domain-containing protein [Bacteroidota bacterium]
MQYWLFKTEPEEYSYQDLAKAGGGTWDGVRNPRALANLAQVRPGDRVFIYHTGKHRAVVGLAEAVSPPYPDPHAADHRLVVVDLAPRGELPRPVTLAEIKTDSLFAGWELVRLPRLSVMPAPERIWQSVLGMSQAGPSK